ncbi:unnamed protein product [Orchesella dallaii]|uniref:Uncharacterized protein n=1 Tax=Orchesella dallaii TaxID=48710 RepID=A0ABP1QP34_9HEXA
MMGCSKISFTRPSVILMGIFFLASIGTNYMACGSPVPQDGKTVEAHFNEAVKTTDDFIQRAKNTFTGKADEVHQGLTPLEIAAVVAGAVVLGFILFCCIGYCLCECVKELICCICCCKCCRD